MQATATFRGSYKVLVLSLRYRDNHLTNCNRLCEVSRLINKLQTNLCVCEDCSFAGKVRNGVEYPRQLDRRFEFLIEIPHTVWVRDRSQVACGGIGFIFWSICWHRIRRTRVLATNKMFQNSIPGNLLGLVCCIFCHVCYSTELASHVAQEFGRSLRDWGSTRLFPCWYGHKDTSVKTLDAEWL